MSSDRQNVDTSVGRGQPGADTGPTAGEAGALSTDAGLALGGVDQAAGSPGYPRHEEDDDRRRREDPGGGYGTGLETGAAALGSSNNAAARVDTFNVPGERAPGERGRDDRDADGRDELRGRDTHRGA